MGKSPVVRSLHGLVCDAPSTDVIPAEAGTQGTEQRGFGVGGAVYAQLVAMAGDCVGRPLVER